MQQSQTQFDTVRRSEYFPAILGAMAGGLAGALIAALIGGRKRKADAPPAEKSPIAAPRNLILGFTAMELMQLATVAANLARQMRDLRDQSSKG